MDCWSTAKKALKSKRNLPVWESLSKCTLEFSSVELRKEYENRVAYAKANQLVQLYWCLALVCVVWILSGLVTLSFTGDSTLLKGISGVSASFFIIGGLMKCYIPLFRVWNMLGSCIFNCALLFLDYYVREVDSSQKYQYISLEIICVLMVTVLIRFNSSFLFNFLNLTITFVSIFLVSRGHFFIFTIMSYIVIIYGAYHGEFFYKQSFWVEKHSNTQRRIIESAVNTSLFYIRHNTKEQRLEFTRGNAKFTKKFGVKDDDSMRQFLKRTKILGESQRNEEKQAGNDSSEKNRVKETQDENKLGIDDQLSRRKQQQSKTNTLIQQIDDSPAAAKVTKQSQNFIWEPMPQSFKDSNLPLNNKACEWNDSLDALIHRLINENSEKQAQKRAAQTPQGFSPIKKIIQIFFPSVQEKSTRFKQEQKHKKELLYLEKDQNSSIYQQQQQQLQRQQQDSFQMKDLSKKLIQVTLERNISSFSPKINNHGNTSLVNIPNNGRMMHPSASEPNVLIQPDMSNKNHYSNIVRLPPMEFGNSGSQNNSLFKEEYRAARTTGDGQTGVDYMKASRNNYVSSTPSHKQPEDNHGNNKNPNSSENPIEASVGYKARYLTENGTRIKFIVRIVIYEMNDTFVAVSIEKEDQLEKYKQAKNELMFIRSAFSQFVQETKIKTNLSLSSLRRFIPISAQIQNQLKEYYHQAASMNSIQDFSQLLQNNNNLHNTSKKPQKSGNSSDPTAHSLQFIDESTPPSRRNEAIHFNTHTCNYLPKLEFKHPNNDPAEQKVQKFQIAIDGLKYPPGVGESFEASNSNNTNGNFPNQLKEPMLGSHVKRDSLFHRRESMSIPPWAWGESQQQQSHSYFGEDNNNNSNLIKESSSAQKKQQFLAINKSENRDAGQQSQQKWKLQLSSSKRNKQILDTQKSQDSFVVEREAKSNHLKIPGIGRVQQQQQHWQKNELSLYTEKTNKATFATQQTNLSIQQDLLDIINNQSDHKDSSLVGVQTSQKSNSDCSPAEEKIKIKNIIRSSLDKGTSNEEEEDEDEEGDEEEDLAERTEFLPENTTKSRERNKLEHLQRKIEDKQEQQQQQQQQQTNRDTRDIKDSNILGKKEQQLPRFNDEKLSNLNKEFKAVMSCLLLETYSCWYNFVNYSFLLYMLCGSNYKRHLKVSLVKLDSLISGMLGMFTSKANSRGVKFDVDAKLEFNEILSDHELLSVMFFNLVQNSLQYSPMNSTVRISVTANSQSSAVTFAITNQVQNNTNQPVIPSFSQRDQQEQQQAGQLTPPPPPQFQVLQKTMSNNNYQTITPSIHNNQIQQSLKTPAFDDATSDYSEECKMSMNTMAERAARVGRLNLGLRVSQKIVQLIGPTDKLTFNAPENSGSNTNNQAVYSVECSVYRDLTLLSKNLQNPMKNNSRYNNLSNIAKPFPLSAGCTKPRKKAPSIVQDVQKTLKFQSFNVFNNTNNKNATNNNLYPNTINNTMNNTSQYSINYPSNSNLNNNNNSFLLQNNVILKSKSISNSNLGAYTTNNNPTYFTRTPSISRAYITPVVGNVHQQDNSNNAQSRSKNATLYAVQQQPLQISEMGEQEKNATKRISFTIMKPSSSQLASSHSLQTSSMEQDFYLRPSDDERRPLSALRFEKYS